MNSRELYMALYEATEKEPVPETDKEIDKLDAEFYSSEAEGRFAEAITEHELRGFILGMRAAQMLVARPDQ